MGTRATIKFIDDYEEYYLYRGHDGFPDIVMNDLYKIIDKKKNSWSGSECGTLVSCFLGETYNLDNRLPDYELTAGFHGEESYIYEVIWSKDYKKWIVIMGRE